MDQTEFNGLSKADYRFLKLVPKTEEAEEIKKVRNGSLIVSEHIDFLIRKLAETHSQTNIASILNERRIYRPNGETWQQFHISRYFKANGIKAICKWKGTLQNER
jgi:hypothetical protein